jgi:high-affinity Fe2+/Pb2+ permease
LASGSWYDFLDGLFGWVADPERARVLAHLAFLVPVLSLFLRPSRTVSVASAPAPAVAPQVAATVER